MPKDTTDKQDDFTFQFKEMQEQMRELVLQSRLLRQNREERSKLATRLASLEAELETPVSTINNPLFAQPSKDHYHHNLTKPLITFQLLLSFLIPRTTSLCLQNLIQNGNIQI